MSVKLYRKQHNSESNFINLVVMHWVLERGFGEGGYKQTMSFSNFYFKYNFISALHFLVLNFSLNFFCSNDISIELKELWLMWWAELGFTVHNIVCPCYCCHLLAPHEAVLCKQGRKGQMLCYRRGKQRDSRKPETDYREQYMS